MNKSDLVEKIFLLNMGSLIRDTRSYFPTEQKGFAGKPNSKPAMTKIPVLAVLLKSKKKNILIDAGFHNDIHSNREKEAVKRGFSEYGTNYTLESNLRKANTQIKEIDMVILTHLHYDHSGGLCAVGDVPLLVHGEEFRSALSSIWQGQERGLYVERDIPRNKNWTLIEKDKLQVAEGVTIYRVGSHTAGSQIVHVTTGSGKSIIFVGDFFHLNDEFASEVTGSAYYNHSEWYPSMKMIKVLADSTHSEVVSSHEPKLFRNFPPAPKFLS